MQFMRLVFTSPVNLFVSLTGQFNLTNIRLINLKMGQCASACQARVTGGDAGLCCCAVTSFER